MQSSALPPENIFGHTKKVRYIIEQLSKNVGENGSVLDFGCGNGSAVSRYIIDSLPGSVRYTGVDMHQDSVEYATKNFARPNASFTMEMPPGPFDAIVYADVLEHLADPVSILREHADKIPRDGIIVGSIPNGWGPFELESSLDRIFRLSPAIAGTTRIIRRVLHRQGDAAPPYNSASGHLQFYRRRRFIKMLNETGFSVTDFRNGTFFGAMVTERVLRFGGESLMQANTNIADRLPYWAASTWLFTATKR